MPFNFTIHHRRTIRLEGYESSQPGAYIVTMVAQVRVCLFGKIDDGEQNHTHLYTEANPENWETDKEHLA